MTPLYNKPKKGFKKKFYNQQRHAFLLTFFDSQPKYQVKEINGFTLVKQLNGNTNTWEVAIYTKEGWDNVLKWKQKNELNQASLL